MRMARKLEKLPLLRRVVDEGTLCASQVRLLVRVADAASEAAWIAKARGLSVRGLAVEVRKALRDGTEGDGGGAADTGGASDPEDGCEDAPSERVAFAAPQYFKAKWAVALELFRKLEGHDGVSDGAAAEAFVAEWSSGQTLPPAASRGAVAAASDMQRAEIAAWRVAARAEADALRAYLEEETDKWSFMPAEMPVVTLPDWLAAADGELSDDPRVLDRELRQWNLHELDALCGRILLTMGRLGLFHAMRFIDIGHYVVERLGMSPRKARELKRLERLLFELPRIQKAYFAGELGYVKVRLLVRVASELTEAAWLERARRVTVRRLEDEVRYVEARGALREARLIEPSEREREHGIGHYVPPPEGFDVLHDGEELAEVARAKRLWHASAQVGTVSFSAEPDVAQLWREGIALCRAVEGRRLAEWECADRFVDAFFAEWERKDPYGAVLAHKVIARDGNRCAVPGCRTRKNLQAHHREWRSRGGTDEISGLSTICAAHHHHGIHEGWVEVTGDAPGNLTWRLGVNGSEALWTVGPGEVILEG